MDLSLDDIIASQKRERKADETRSKGQNTRGKVGGAGNGGRKGSANSKKSGKGSGKDAKLRQGNSGRQPGSGGGKVRHRRKQQFADPYVKPQKRRPSVSGKNTEFLTGVEVYIENLHFDVEEDDLEELFREVGRVKKSVLERNRNGKSMGRGYVVMSRRDADVALREFDGRRLDGRVMRITIRRRQNKVGRTFSDKQHPLARQEKNSNRNLEAQRPRRHEQEFHARKKNVRNGDRSNNKLRKQGARDLPTRKGNITAAELNKALDKYKQQNRQKS